LRASKLDVAYNREKDADVKERMLLVRLIVEDKKYIEEIAKELHRCRAWAYKWYKRYNEDGLDGLKDKERSGRPPDVPKEVMIKIQKELADSNTGWDFRQVMDLIYKKTGVRYHEVHITGYYIDGALNPKYHKKRFVNTASEKEKRKFKKE
jgi:transposase